MPSWGDILVEIDFELEKRGDPNALKNVLNKYVGLLSKYTERNTILYTSNWTSGHINDGSTSFIEGDLGGFIQAVHGLDCTKGLDVILDTPGGSPYAVQAIVHYLRQKFENIRVIVPHAAMSAGTMFACGSDEIIMANHSFLGPIDPQLILETQLGIRMVPAFAILGQFEKAEKEIQDDPSKLNVWLPMLGQFGPSLIMECYNAIEFGEELVSEWLNDYMLKNQSLAKEIAKKLSDHTLHKAHAKHISSVEAKNLGLKVIDLEKDQILQDYVLSIYHSYNILYSKTQGVSKIITNNISNTKFYFQYSQNS